MNLKVSSQTASQLQQLAITNHRNLSGQAAFLIDQAFQLMQKEVN